MSVTPLSLVVRPPLIPRAQRAGFSLTTLPATTAATLNAVLQAWSQGQREVICEVEAPTDLLALRPLALFASTFGEILLKGTFRELSLVTGGLRATTWETRHQGSLILIENPTEHTCWGSVFPAFQELTLPSGGVLACLHDTPIGKSTNYLAAYAGLVKSEAQVVTAQIRPDPFEGICLVVSAPVGSIRELVLFNAGPGEATTLSFREMPQLVRLGPSLVLMVPDGLAGHVWLGEGDSPTWIGPDDVLERRTVVMGGQRLWELSAAGKLTEVTFGIERDEIQEAGWYATQIEGGDEPTIVQLNFEHPCAHELWLNGERILDKELCLIPGTNRLVISLTERGNPGQVTVIPDGACYLVELTQWRYWPDGPLAV